MMLAIYIVGGICLYTLVGHLFRNRFIFTEARKARAKGHMTFQMDGESELGSWMWFFFWPFGILFPGGRDELRMNEKTTRFQRKLDAIMAQRTLAELEAELEIVRHNPNKNCNCI